MVLRRIYDYTFANTGSVPRETKAAAQKFALVQLLLLPRKRTMLETSGKMSHVHQSGRLGDFGMIFKQCAKAYSFAQLLTTSIKSNRHTKFGVAHMKGMTQRLPL